MKPEAAKTPCPECGKLIWKSGGSHKAVAILIAEPILPDETRRAAVLSAHALPSAYAVATILQELFG
jgi:hypothetical protein